MDTEGKAGTAPPFPCASRTGVRLVFTSCESPSAVLPRRHHPERVSPLPPFPRSPQAPAERGKPGTGDSMSKYRWYLPSVPFPGYS